MQSNCYKRNYHSSVCVDKCKFRRECDVYAAKEHRLKYARYSDDEISEIKDALFRGKFK